MINPIITTQLGTIQNNLEDVEASIKAYCDQYKNIAVTEETITDSKQLVADIRKQKKELDDIRKQIKTEWNKPYLELESKIKKLLELYDEPVNMINGQLSEFESQRKEEKRKEIAKIHDSIIGESDETPDCLRLSAIYNEKWENKTYSNDMIAKDCEDLLSKYEMSESTIKFTNHPYERKGLEILRKTNDLQEAIKSMQAMAEIAKELKTANTKAEPVEEMPFGIPDVIYKVTVPYEKSAAFEAYCIANGMIYEEEA